MYLSFLQQCLIKPAPEQCSEGATCSACLVYFCQTLTGEVWKKLIKNLVLWSYTVEKGKGKKKEKKSKKEKARKKKLNEGYTESADTLTWFVLFLFFLSKQLEECN